MNYYEKSMDDGPETRETENEQFNIKFKAGYDRYQNQENIYKIILQ